MLDTHRQQNRMSTHKGGSIKSYDSRTAVEIDQLVDTVTEALDSVDADSDVIEAVERQGDRTVEAAEEEFEELKEQLEAEADRRSAEIEGVHSRISRVEADSGDDNPTPESGESEDTEPQSSLETVCSLPEETAEENLTVNQQRARFVAKDISDYGRKVPAGIAIKSSEIRRVLTASEEGSIHTETVSRVMDFLDRLGGDGVRVKKTRSGENTVVFSEEIAERITAVVIEERPGGVIEAAI